MTRTLAVAASLLFLGWLVPNHELPWTAAFADACAIAGTLLLAAVAARTPAVPWPDVAVAALCIALVPLVQHASGRIEFLGDAVMATLYLVMFALAIVGGHALTTQLGLRRLAKTIAAPAVFAGVLSVGIATYQWLSLSGLDIYAVELPRGHRPFANVSQPNHLATLLGMCAVLSVLLFRIGALGRWALFLVLAWLLFGVVMTRSRTGVVEFLVVVVLLLLTRRRDWPALRLSVVASVAVAFFALHLAWPAINDGLLLAPARTASQQLDQGTRWMHWRVLSDAVAERPWFGYGWNQVSIAQFDAVLHRPAPREMIEHSHNIVLDLLLWNGVPIGALILIGVFAWYVRAFRSKRDPTTGLLLLACIVPLTHAFFEYPLEYAYFLLPVGVMMGLVSGHTSPRGWISSSRAVFMVCIASAMIVATAVAHEYLVAKDNLRTLRMEVAKIGTGSITSTAPDLHLLTAHREYLRLARQEAMPGLSTDELDEMRVIVSRFGFPPALFRYALASGLNGRPTEARDALIRLCKLHHRDHCEEARRSWELLGGTKYPVLRQVPWPVSDTSSAP